MLSQVGLSTFARSPLATLDSDWHADAAVLGVPFEIAAGDRRDAGFGPRAIREASVRYSVPSGGLWNWHTNETILAGRTLRDVGDVELPSVEPERARERIEAAARSLRARCVLPVFLGGDHSVTYPLLRAFDDVDDLHVVQLDAHLDFSDLADGARYATATSFRRAAEALPNLTHITTIGLRGARTDREAMASARARGHTLLHADRVSRDGQLPPDSLPAGKSVYLSIDVDVFDQSALTGSPSPESDGLNYRKVSSVIRAVSGANRLVGVECVELSPEVDAAGHGAGVVARLIVETMGMALP